MAARPLVAEWTITIVSCSHGSPVSLVADAAPEVDDLLAAMIGAAGAAQLAASSEVLGKRLAHRLETATDVSLYRV